MTGNLEPDDGRRGGDALDRAIDEALGAELGGSPTHLRARVLARLEEPVEDQPSRWLGWVRPAMLPAAGALLIVVAVTLSWWRIDDQLGRIGSGQYAAEAVQASRSKASGTVALGGPAPAGVPASGGESAASASGRPPARVRGDRIFAASLLEMDRLAGRKGLGAAMAAADEDEPVSFLPGAVAGDLGDPIRPIPRPRPIEIPPIVTAPIVDAPPVSTLATPVSTLSTDSSSRDQSGPGKSEGVRP